MAQKKAINITIGSNLSEDSFESIAREFIELHKSSITPRQHRRNIQMAESRLFPILGCRPIKTIKTIDILTILRDIENQGFFEVVSKIKILVSQIFKYAIITNRAEYNITANLNGALKSKPKRHFPSLSDPKDLKRLLLAIDDYNGTTVVKAALKLAPLVFVRPGELRNAEWAELDLENAEWRIPAAKMKMKKAHIVPLSRQSLAIIQELKPLTGQGRFLFPGPRTIVRPITDATLLNALRNMGFTKDEMVVHGFRSIASTRLKELGYNWDWIERQLAHAPGGVRGANYPDYLPERRKMLQDWADHLDKLKNS
jgi:integrase